MCVSKGLRGPTGAQSAPQTPSFKGKNNLQFFLSTSSKPTRNTDIVIVFKHECIFGWSVHC